MRNSALSLRLKESFVINTGIIVTLVNSLTELAVVTFVLKFVIRSVKH